MAILVVGGNKMAYDGSLAITGWLYVQGTYDWRTKNSKPRLDPKLPNSDSESSQNFVQKHLRCAVHRGRDANFMSKRHCFFAHRRQLLLLVDRQVVQFSAANDTTRPSDHRSSSPCTPGLPLSRPIHRLCPSVSERPPTRSLRDNFPGVRVWLF